MVFKDGHTRQEAATRHGVSLRTVYYVLRNTLFTRAPKPQHNHDFRDHATNMSRQAAQCAACRDVVPQPPVPVFARSTIALKLFWRRIAKERLQAAADRRWQSTHKRTVNRLSREIGRYKAAIARHDPDRAQRVIDASKAWLQELTATFGDPLPILVRHQQQTMARQRARQYPPTKRNPKRKEPRA